MTDTPLDLSKRYKTRGTDATVLGLRVVERASDTPSQHIAGELLYSDGHRVCVWHSNGQYMPERGEHPLDLIPCEDE